jgi:hypothetical protein
MTRTALELVGQSGLGYSFDPMVEGVDPHPYSKSIKQLVWVLNHLDWYMHLLTSLPAQ